MTDAPLAGSGFPTLAAFVRHVRTTADPEARGVAPGRGGRRGLRRAQVAEMAGLSLAYYTMIEQGREPRPSHAVLDALGRALGLDANERRLMRDLAGGSAYHAPLEPETVSDTVVELVESLEPNPAYVLGARWDVLHANRGAHLLFADWPSRPVSQRNMLWYYVCDPAARSIFVDWRTEAADQLAHFRPYYARRPDDPSFRALLEVIFEHTPEARGWWEGHEADPRRSGLRRVRLPTGGQALLRQVVLQDVDNPEIQVVAYFADVDLDGELDEGFDGYPGEDTEALFDQA
jgi:transcriptional regulator with XRE-family HTH domain